jgi:hypothetical protein
MPNAQCQSGSIGRRVASLANSSLGSQGAAGLPRAPAWCEAPALATSRRGKQNQPHVWVAAGCVGPGAVTRLVLDYCGGLSSAAAVAATTRSAMLVSVTRRSHARPGASVGRVTPPESPVRAPNVRTVNSSSTNGLKRAPTPPLTVPPNQRAAPGYTRNSGRSPDRSRLVGIRAAGPAAPGLSGADPPAG